MSASIHPDYDFIMTEVSGKVKVRDHYLRDDGSIEFRVEHSETLKENFRALLASLKKRNYTALLRSVDSELVLAVGRSIFRTHFRSTLPMILFLATIGTVAIDGFLRFRNFPVLSLIEVVFLYTLGIMGIIGIHELGHKVASTYHRMPSSLPYFIPGIPGLWPTWGALITSGEPPVNKDALFDLGISGPIAGLVATFAVAIGGALTSVPLSLDIITKQVGSGELQLVSRMDTFTAYLLQSLSPRPTGTGLVLSPLIFASSIGFLITFLNLLPAWQLDGGHIARAAMGRGKHRILTYVAIAVMFVMGFQIMALLILLLSTRSPEMRPLDDVSRLSKRRKIVFVSVVAMAALLWFLTIRDNPYIFRTL